MVRKPPASTDTVRLYEIDFLRFLAACAVMLFHYTFCAPADHTTTVSFNILGSVFKYGYLGVELFFVISGFVILMSAANKSPLGFAVSRMVRLYPAYWACCTLTFLVILATGVFRSNVTYTQYILNLTMLNGFIGIPSIDGVYWTLAAEMRFYAMLFVILLFRGLKYMKYYLGVWLIASLVLTTYKIRYLGFFVIPEYSAFFIAGCLFFLLYREGNSIYKTFLLIVSYMLSLLQANAELLSYAARFKTTLSFTVVICFLSFVYATFYAIACKGTSFARYELFGLLGRLTYPLYLLHAVIGYIFLESLKTCLNKYTLLASIIIMMLGMSYLVNIKVERVYAKPFNRLLKRLIDRKPLITEQLQ